MISTLNWKFSNIDETATQRLYVNECSEMCYSFDKNSDLMWTKEGQILVRCDHS